MDHVDMTDQRLLTPPVVADMLGVKPRTLIQMRSQGWGPAYVRVGRLVRYREGDVRAYVAGLTTHQGGARA